MQQPLNRASKRPCFAQGPRVPLLLYAPVFVVALGYGSTLPLLPAVLDGLHQRGTPDRYSLHAGVLAALYIVASGLAAPWWGRWVDRHGPKSALIIGLLGYAAALAALVSSSQLLLAYAARFAAGLFAAALLPATVVAVVRRFVESDRTQHIGWISTTTITGALIGPAMTGTLSRLVAPSLFTLYAALWLAVLLAVVCAASVAVFTRADGDVGRRLGESHAASNLRTVLLLTLVGAVAHGIIEVGISILARSRLSGATAELSWIFAACSLSMIVWQWLVLPTLAQKFAVHLRVQISFVVVAIGFLLVANASSFMALIASVTLVSLALSTILGSMTLATARLGDALGIGTTFGNQASASAIGQGIGSLIAGIVFTRLSHPFESFAVVMLLAAAYALRLPYSPPANVSSDAAR